jgi:hypothetical protein
MARRIADWDEMKRILMAATAVILTGCAQTDYQVYEGRNGPKIVEGQGGTKSVIDGYEVWDNGSPPRRYQVLGVVEIEDFDNIFGRQRIQSALVNHIKAVNGSAAVVVSLSGGGNMLGTMVSSSGRVSTGMGFGKKVNSYEIVRYLD